MTSHHSDVSFACKMKGLLGVFDGSLKNDGFDMSDDGVEIVVVLKSLILPALVHGFFVFDFVTGRESWSQ